MNILVVGHSVADKIIDSGSVSAKPGGIYYTIAALLSLINTSDKIFLCSAIDKENESLFKDAYEKIQTEFLTYIDSIPKVELVVSTSGERKEIYSVLAPNLLLPEVNLNRFDAILINMISGFDISLEQLFRLRSNYNGLIYFDIHTLSRGVDEKFNRVFRRVENFNKWAECINILQANESELLTLSTREKEEAIIEELFSYGINQIIITRAERGATVFFRENRSIKSFHKDALKVNAVNKVGCGDVFGAVYFYNYIKNKNVLLALEQANLFAGLATTYNNISDFIYLRTDAVKWVSKK